MKTVDTRGMACPQPLIMTRKALDGLSADTQLNILIDNPTSCGSVQRFLADNGMDVQCTQEGNLFTLSVQKPHAPRVHPQAASYCTAAPRPHIIVFAQDKMGQGSEELGYVLVQALVNIIEEVNPLPSHLVFYNSGIVLVCDGSPLIESLKKLERKGVVILVCGTCAKHFNKIEEVKVGTVSNMYTILEIMTNAGHIIQP